MPKSKKSLSRAQLIKEHGKPKLQVIIRGRKKKASTPANKKRRIGIRKKKRSTYA